MSLLQAQLPQGTVNLCSPAKRFRVHALGHPFAVARSAPDAAPWQYRRQRVDRSQLSQPVRQQIDTHVRHVARVLSESGFPLTANVLRQMKGLSEAEYVLVGAEGHQTATLPADPASLPPRDAITDDWQNLHLGPRAPLSAARRICVAACS